MNNNYNASGYNYNNYEVQHPLPGARNYEQHYEQHPNYGNIPSQHPNYGESHPPVDVYYGNRKPRMWRQYYYDYGPEKVFPPHDHPQHAYYGGARYGEAPYYGAAYYGEDAPHMPRETTYLPQQMPGIETGSVSDIKY